MAEAALKTVKPNGHNPLFGDSDDTDMRDIMSRCALVFGRSDFKYYGFDRLDFQYRVADRIQNVLKKYNNIGKSTSVFN